jgi:hypothetical protein
VGVAVLRTLLLTRDGYHTSLRSFLYVLMFGSKAAEAGSNRRKNRDVKVRAAACVCLAPCKEHDRHGMRGKRGTVALRFQALSNQMSGFLS